MNDFISHAVYTRVEGNEYTTGNLFLFTDKGNVHELKIMQKSNINKLKDSDYILDGRYTVKPSNKSKFPFGVIMRQENENKVNIISNEVLFHYESLDNSIAELLNKSKFDRLIFDAFQVNTSIVDKLVLFEYPLIVKTVTLKLKF